MRSVRFICVVCLFASVAAGQATTTADMPASREDVIKLFSVMKTREQTERLLQQACRQMMNMQRDRLRKENPDITPQELSRFDSDSETLLKNFPIDEMIQDQIPIYQKHLNRTDVLAMTEFYSSPTGQKFLREMPAIVSEGMQAMYPRLERMVQTSFKHGDEKNGPQEQVPAAPTTRK